MTYDFQVGQRAEATRRVFNLKAGTMKYQARTTTVIKITEQEMDNFISGCKIQVYPKAGAILKIIKKELKVTLLPKRS